MAILGKIRQRSLILILVIAMALFSFVLADLFRGGGLSASDGIVATVNGKDIERTEFMQKVERAQQQLGGRGSSVQAMNTVWDQELRKAVLETQYDELGLTVERTQMRDLLKQGLGAIEEFNNEAGEFDENKLNEFIANLQAIYPQPAILGTSQINYDDWRNYENDIAANGLYQTYYNMVQAGITGTIADGKLEHKLENDKVDMKFVQIPYSSIQDSTVSVSKDEIASYINKNKSDFEVDASRDIYYVQFNEEASLEDEETIKSGLLGLLDDRVEYNEASKLNDTIEGLNNTSDVASYINANSEIKFFDQFLFKNKLATGTSDSIFARNIGDTYGPYKQGNYYVISKLLEERFMPDSAKVRHILIPFVGATRADATVTKTDAEAKKTADSIYNVLRYNRSKFVSLLDLSSDSVSNEKGGEIEFTYDQSFAPEFKDFSFENNVGDLEVVRTDFGYHIIEILDQGTKQRALKIADLARSIEASETTINDVFNKTSKFEIAVAGSSFQDVASENDYVVKQSTEIKELDETIIGLGAQRQIVRWAFEADTKIGQVRRFSLTNGYVVAVLARKNKDGTMSVEKASVRVLPILRKEKKAALIRAGISGSTLEEVATSQNQTVRTAVAVNMKNPTLSGAGQEPKIIGTAFGLTEGSTSGLVDGTNGVYMVQVTKISPADELPSYASAATQATQAKINAATVALYNALKAAAQIEDNRAAIY